MDDQITFGLHIDGFFLGDGSFFYYDVFVVRCSTTNADQRMSAATSMAARTVLSDVSF